jgi:hypothetical protein
MHRVHWVTDPIPDVFTLIYIQVWAGLVEKSKGSYWGHVYIHPYPTHDEQFK